jgi:hypothetical protein
MQHFGQHDGQNCGKQPLERFRFSSLLGRPGETRGWARHSAATAGAYTKYVSTTSPQPDDVKG